MSSGPKSSSRASSDSGSVGGDDRGPDQRPPGPGVAAAVEDHLGARRRRRASTAAAIRSRASGATSGQTSTPLLVAGPDAERRRRPSASASSARSCSVAGADEHRDRAGEAALAGGAEGRGHDRRDGHLEVGVGHHDERVLRPAERLEALAGGRRALGDVAGGRRLADERDRVDPGMVEQPVDRVAGAVDEVETPAGISSIPSISSKISSDGRGSRSDGLRMKRVAAGDRERQEPERDHRREVERGDRGDDADRLAHQLDVDPAGDALEVLALEQVRDPAGRLGRLDPAQDLAAGVVERLAHVGGDQPGELLAALPERLAQRHHRAGALLRRDVAPRRLRLARGARPRRRRRPRPESGTSAAQLAGRRVAVLERLAGRRPRPSRRRCSCAASGLRSASRLRSVISRTRPVVRASVRRLP